MPTCAGTEIVNTINSIRGLSQKTNINSSFLMLVLSTMNTGTCLKVLDKPELLNNVFDKRASRQGYRKVNRNTKK